MVLGMLTSCQKEVETYSLQYKVLEKSGNKADYSLHYLSPSQSTISTGIIDTSVWYSELFLEVEKDANLRLEVKSDYVPKLDIIILKNNTVFARHEIRNSSDDFFISDNL